MSMRAGDGNNESSYSGLIIVMIASLMCTMSCYIPVLAIAIKVSPKCVWA